MEKALLYLDCCVRGDRSRTRRLAEAFFAALPPAYQVTRLDLTAMGLQPLCGEFFQQREALLEQGALDHPRFRLAHQLAAADAVVIAAPFWDLSFPALLKLYIENVSVEGITFRSGATGLQGLCHAERYVFLTTRGGVYAPGETLEQAVPYLTALGRFFGFGPLETVAADGLDVQELDGPALLEAACAKAAALAKTL